MSEQLDYLINVDYNLSDNDDDYDNQYDVRYKWHEIRRYARDCPFSNELYEYCKKHINDELVYCFCYFNQTNIHHLANHVTLGLIEKMFVMFDSRDLGEFYEIASRNWYDIDHETSYEVALFLAKRKCANILKSNLYSDFLFRKTRYDAEIVRHLQEVHPDMQHEVWIYDDLRDIGRYYGLKICIAIYKDLFIKCLDTLPDGDHIFYKMLRDGDITFKRFIFVDRREYVRALCGAMHDEVYDYICDSPYYLRRDVKSARNF